MNDKIFLKGTKLLTNKLKEVKYTPLSFYAYQVCGDKYGEITLNNLSISEDLVFYGTDCEEVVSSLFKIGYYEEDEKNKLIELIQKDACELKKLKSFLISENHHPENFFLYNKTNVSSIKYSTKEEYKSDYSKYKLMDKIDGM
jgi:hypothetical protein